MTFSLNQAVPRRRKAHPKRLETITAKYSTSYVKWLVIKETNLQMTLLSLFKCGAVASSIQSPLYCSNRQVVVSLLC